MKTDGKPQNAAIN